MPKRELKPLLQANEKYFITKLVAEDRCHLNGLAMVDGQPTYVKACSMTDSVAGWRSGRNDSSDTAPIAT